MNKVDWENGIPERGVPAKCKLFSIEILFVAYYDDTGNPTNDIRRWHIFNQGWHEVRSFRETIFTHGFFLERSPGRGEIIFPADFRKIMVDVQPKGFKDFI